jgi:type IV secretory pathway VirB2 component (pilin)
MQRKTPGFSATFRSLRSSPTALAVLGTVLTAVPAHADSPWEIAVSVLQTAFTGPIARGLSLVAIVVDGLMFAFGEGESQPDARRALFFGVGMAIGAVNFMAWLFRRREYGPRSDISPGLQSMNKPVTIWGGERRLFSLLPSWAVRPSRFYSTSNPAPV